jgi:hypothetical protein
LKNAPNEDDYQNRQTIFNLEGHMSEALYISLDMHKEKIALAFVEKDEPAM